MKESQKEVSATIAKIDASGSGMREANQKIANTFRTYADKETVDYSYTQKKWSKTEMVKKPWIAKQKILEGMELRLDAAIDKTENLARDVEIDQMMKKFDSFMEKTHTEQVISMVAEPESQYRPDIFAAFPTRTTYPLSTPICTLYVGFNCELSIWSSFICIQVASICIL